MNCRNHLTGEVTEPKYVNDLRKLRKQNVCMHGSVGGMLKFNQIPNEFFLGCQIVKKKSL